MASFSNEPKNNSITPCTLSMISKVTTENESAKMFNKQIEQVEVTAKIREMGETALRYEFKLLDYTHFFTGVFYKKTNVPSSKQLKDFEYTENCYVLIYGVFRKAQETTFVISKIQNIKSYQIIDEFLSRTLVSYILKYSPTVNNTNNIEEDIISALKKAGTSLKGYTCSSIQNMLSLKLSVDQIEENIHELIFKGLVKNGADWNHFLLAS